MSETPIEPIVLDAAPGSPARPPVRIFLGTEPAQHRPERVFVHALTRVRDPSRRYEVYLMKRIPGFDERDWRTGFTNYRFAVPELAGLHGRAIYNDVDQLWLADPAPLFDADLEGHGYLALTPVDTAVMLIDCARMGAVWNLTTARVQRKKALHALGAADGRFGELDAVWHARDLEYRPGISKLLHFTTLHLQPWRPTPDDYTYEVHPYADTFLSLEDAADAAGFELYTAGASSPGFAAAARAAGVAPDRPPAPGDLEALAAKGFAGLPNEDLPWLVDALFASTSRPARIVATLRDDGGIAASTDGWLRIVRRVARRHPGRRWELVVRDRGGDEQRWQSNPGLAAAAAPRVWVLEGTHAGDNAQLATIARALGWPCETKSARIRSRWAHRFNSLLGGLLSPRLAPQLRPPWPELVLTAGRRTTQVARWIRRASGGRTKVALVGRSQTPIASADVVLTTPQYGLPLEANVVSLPAPVVDPKPVDAATLAAWRQRLAALPRPWIALLVGGSAHPHRLDVESARRLARQASEAAQARGGSLLVSTSPRTPADAADALFAAIDAPHHAHRYARGGDNPYPAFLALADAFVVTGDSVTMLTEAATTGRPLAVFPLPIHRKRKLKFRHALEKWAGLVERPAGIRGTEKQQDALGRLYLRLVALGIVRRERQFALVHTALGLRPLPEGLAQPPSFTPQMLAASRSRALAAIRDAMIAARAPGAAPGDEPKRPLPLREPTHARPD